MPLTKPRAYQIYDIDYKQAVRVLTLSNVTLSGGAPSQVDGVNLNFEKESLNLIAERTLKTKTGARGLHTELERILLPHMFDLPKYRKQSILSVAITSNLVNKPETLARENE
jgi:ATP-dependent Clp protease ATP-binding subunit ClpX